MTTEFVRPVLRACRNRAAQILPASRGALCVYLAVVELELPAAQVRRALSWRRGDLDAALLDVEDLREDPELDEAIATAAGDLRASLALRPPAAAPAPVPVEVLNAQRTARNARRALELLLAAGGGIVGHEAFGTPCSARTAICAARKKIGPGAIRTIRGRGFQITEAGLKALRAKLSRFGETPDSLEGRWLPALMSERAAA